MYNPLGKLGPIEEIDVGYYTVYQPLRGVNYQVAEIVVANNAGTETWFLYTAGNVYQWPSSRNPVQQMTYNYAGTKTVAQVQAGLAASGQAYQQITLAVQQQSAASTRSKATAKAKAAGQRATQAMRRASTKVKGAVKKAGAKAKKVGAKAKKATTKKKR